MNKFTYRDHFITVLNWFVETTWKYPRIVLLGITVVTVFFAAQLPAVRIVSDFADLLPQHHPYIQLHNEIRDTFGGANNIIVSVTVRDGTIFSNETLDRIHRITLAVDALEGINHNLVTSLTHRNVRKVWLSGEGTVKSTPYYDPLKGGYSVEELDAIRQSVLADGRVFGLIVSPDLKSALVRGTLNEGALDYEKVFTQLQLLREQEAAEGLEIHATGQPMLVGWVSSYAEQIFTIFLLTIAIMLALLVIHFKSLYGIVLPLIGIIVTSIWGLGVLSLLGYNLDPLMLVIPFVISARAMSHGIQIVERYYQEVAQGHDGKYAAHLAFSNLFRPGTLGVVSDAIGLLLIAVGSVPINDKLAVYACFWALAVIFTVIIMVPCMLQLLPTPPARTVGLKFVAILFRWVAKKLTAPRAPAFVLAGCIVLFLGALAATSLVTIGETKPGSPLLYEDHDYNVSSKIINDSFPGSEELYVIGQTAEVGGLKRPEVVKALADLQAHMLTDPNLGGTKGLPDLIRAVNRITHYNDPRWYDLPEDPALMGGLMFLYMMSSPVQGALLEYLDTDEINANIVFYYKDHQGSTIRRAIEMVNQWKEDVGSKIDGFTLKLAGGTIGVNAAINESAFSSNLIIIPLVFALIFLAASAFYSSLHAGLIMLVAMCFATTLTYAYMGLVGIGINVNTVPIIAVGIGIGIDYSIYLMDRVRSEYASCLNFDQAITSALETTGKAVGFTAAVLIGGVVMWVFVSKLKFQADAAMLLIVMLGLNAVAAIFLVPAWLKLFTPEFIARQAQ
ncbi:MAG TPA: MMPL family transporter [Xanthomonadales bacterium]|nr:MMPL family transporter [Xanthomonadales bacterium]